MTLVPMTSCHDARVPAPVEGVTAAGTWKVTAANCSRSVLSLEFYTQDLVGRRGSETAITTVVGAKQDVRLEDGARATRGWTSRSWVKEHIRCGDS